MFKRLLWFWAALAAVGFAAPVQAHSYRVYFGTYTGKDSQGIYQAKFNPHTGALTDVELAAETVSPSFLAIHPNGQFLYAVGEISDFQGKKTGGVSAFSIDATTGKLTLLNQQSSEGAGPCHVTVNKAGTAVFVANYGGGSCASYPLAADGKIGPAAATQQHTGSSVNAQRQKAPHAHSINLDPNNRFAFVADLGLDKVLVYKFDDKTSAISPNEPPFAVTKPGGGPRHLAFHPSGKFAFVNLELTSQVSSFAYNPHHGLLKEVDTLSTLPQDFTGNNSTAEVVAHPNGQFVYVSNRGHDSIAGFKVDPESGKLKSLGQTPTGGKTPRNFNIDPEGKWLLAANQSTGNVSVFAIDPATGALTAKGEPVNVPSPVCVRFLLVKKPAR